MDVDAIAFADAQEIYVTDAAGKKVKTVEETSASKCDLNLTGFTKGVYMVHITAKDGLTTTKKIILE